MGIVLVQLTQPLTRFCLTTHGCCAIIALYQRMPSFLWRRLHRPSHRRSRRHLRHHRRPRLAVTAIQDFRADSDLRQSPPDYAPRGALCPIRRESSQVAALVGSASPASVWAVRNAAWLPHLVAVQGSVPSPAYSPWPVAQGRCIPASRSMCQCRRSMRRTRPCQRQLAPHSHTRGLCVSKGGVPRPDCA